MQRARLDNEHLMLLSDGWSRGRAGSRNGDELQKSTRMKSEVARNPMNLGLGFDLRPSWPST